MHAERTSARSRLQRNTANVLPTSALHADRAAAARFASIPPSLMVVLGEKSRTISSYAIDPRTQPEADLPLPDRQGLDWSRSSLRLTSRTSPGCARVAHVSAARRSLAVDSGGRLLRRSSRRPLLHLAACSPFLSKVTVPLARAVPGGCSAASAPAALAAPCGTWSSQLLGALALMVRCLRSGQTSSITASSAVSLRSCVALGLGLRASFAAGAHQGVVHIDIVMPCGAAAPSASPSATGLSALSCLDSRTVRVLGEGGNEDYVQATRSVV